MNRERDLLNQAATLGISIPAQALGGLFLYLDELLRWAKRINLTSVTDPGLALEKHLLDSLTLLPFIGSGERLLDLGSGAGLPGIPLKLNRPDLDLWSVDAVAKKIAFQRHIARLLGLQGFHPCHGRAEKLADAPALAGSCTLVVSRAFASLGDFLRLGLPFLAPDGRLVAMKGPEGEAELSAAAELLTVLGLECREVCQRQLPQSRARRTLLVFQRTAEELKLKI